MAFRIQPTEIDVPEDDPFSNDLLGRKESIEILTHLVGSFEGPCVLAVDAPWGTGKTTFFRMWHQHLRNDGFFVAEFNAWETDFSGDPLLALSTELLSSLEASADTPWRPKVEKLKEGVPKLLKAAAPTIISAATHGLVDVTSFLEPAERVSRYREAVQLFRGFREDLQDIAISVSESRSGKPLIILIDELDRCRPPYAVELLEVAKHLFASRHVVFALAVNRAELEHSVQALYGDGFDAHGYLSRFFDLDYRLPDPERDAFIEATLEGTGINDYLRQTRDHDAREEATLVKEMLQAFFSLPQLSVRTISQAIHRLGLLYASVPEGQRALLLSATTALILRTLAPDLYREFGSGKVTAGQVIRRLSAEPHGLALHKIEKGFVFESQLFLADDQSVDPLLSEYTKLAETERPSGGEGLARWRHAGDVVRIVQAAAGRGWPEWSSRSYWAAVGRVDLISGLRV